MAVAGSISSEPNFMYAVLILDKQNKLSGKFKIVGIVFEKLRKLQADCV